MGVRLKQSISNRVCCVLCGIVLLLAAPAGATIDVAPGAAGDLDAQTMNEVLAMFRQAERAVHSRNLAGIMELYSEQYDYHGLTKADVAKIWQQLFDEYQDVSDIHRLSKFTKAGSGPNTVIEVTCTGSLWGMSKTSGLRVPIDSWFQEIHYVTLEGGTWRIRGNVGETPRLMPFGTSPHPLF
jgi:hypothetical protein